jgi:hypothetical protein
MGTVPIPNIEGLSVTRTEDPVIEPPPPVSRVEAASRNPSGSRDQAAARRPSESSPDASPIDAETESSPTEEDQAHQIDLFA